MIAVTLALIVVAVPLVGASGSGIKFSLHVSSRRIVFRGSPFGCERAAWLRPRGSVSLPVGGSPIAFSHETLSGPGRITGHFASAGPVYMFLCSRGADPAQGGGVDVSLPADSTSTLSYSVRIADATWPSMRPTMGAYAHVPAVDPNDLGLSLELGTEHLTPAGTRGIRITLSAPGARPQKHSFYRLVSSRRAALIAGTTDPTLGNTEVRLAAMSYLGQQLTIRTKPIGTTRTDSHGRFRLRWTPGSAGST